MPSPAFGTTIDSAPASKFDSAEQRVLVALDADEKSLFFPDTYFESMRLQGCEFHFPAEMAQREWAPLLEEYDPTIIMSCWSTRRLPKENFSRSSLRYLCHLTGSVRHVVSRKMLENGLLVTNWGDLTSLPVAEHALLLALAALRNMPNWPTVLRSSESKVRQARNSLRTRTLSGRRIGLHGFGRIARSLVTLLKPFRSEIHIYSAGVPNAFIEEHDAIPCDSLDELFACSDVLFECEALTPASTGSITRDLLLKLPHDAVFINVGRGAVVAPGALEELAISKGLRIGLDVFDPEPLEIDSPFYEAPCAVLSPHIGGPTHDQYLSCGSIALENILRFAQGQMPQYVITPEIYDLST
jgi:phosphoglycerate dehydrogenase-like enzyme